MTAHLQERLRDTGRLTELRRLGLLDSTADEAFDRLTRLATRLLHAPVSLVSLVEGDRQFFKSCIGLPEPWTSRRETPLTHSFCQHVVASGDPLIIEDARRHPLVRDNLAIVDLDVVAYAGIPLVTSEGYALGSFCVIDSRPRVWAAEELAILRDLAAAAMTEIELRAAIQEAQHQAREAERGRREKAALLESVTEGIFGIDPDGRCTFINTAAANMLGYTSDELLGRRIHDLSHHSHADGSPYPADACPVAQSLRSREAVRTYDEILWRRDGTAFPSEYSSSPMVEDGRIAGAVVTFVDVTERRRVAEEARSASQQLAEQAKMLALLEERERIAMDLHDGVIQSLYGIALSLGARAYQENTDPAWQPVDEAIAQINHVIQQIRNYIFDLRPRNDADGGLRPGLELLAKELRVNGLVHPELDVPAGEEAALSPEIVDQMLAIAREATYNVIRHARATAMTIRLRCNDDRLVLVMRDNGCGFDPGDPPRRGGLGLGNMSERARAIGGEARVVSRPGGGTEVRVELPVPQQPRPSAEEGT